MTADSESAGLGSIPSGSLLGHTARTSIAVITFRRERSTAPNALKVGWARPIWQTASGVLAQTALRSIGGWPELIRVGHTTSAQIILGTYRRVTSSAANALETLGARTI